MSAYTLQGPTGPAAPLQAATVRIPRFGVWTAKVATVDALELVDGARVTITVGDLALVGTKIDGGTYGGESSFTIVGGTGAWSAVVPKKAHRSDGGITVAEVAADLDTDASAAAGVAPIGIVLESGVERPLGYAWERRAAVAADALTQLMGDAWWIAPDGSTHLGARPTRNIAPATLRVLGYDPAIRLATVALEDDAVAQLLPGARLTSSDLPDVLEVGATTIRVEGGAVEVDLLGERPPSEMLSGFLALLRQQARLSAPQLYTVTSNASGRTSARAAGPAAAGLPDLDGIDGAFGLPGARATLAGGELVGVVLLDGSPGAPRVALYLPGTLPLSVGLDAPSIELGAAGAVAPLSLAGLTDAAHTTIITAFNALCVATGHAGLALLGVPSTACQKAKGE